MTAGCTLVSRSTATALRGISTGIDVTLTVVRRTRGEAVAGATARYMEYPHPESNTRRIEL